MKKSVFPFHPVKFLTFAFLLLSGSFFTVRAAGEVDAAFNPAVVSVGSYINRLAVQPDGKTLAVGRFQTVGKTAINNIVRLNADGTLDATFRPPSISPCFVNTEKYRPCFQQRRY